MDGCVCKFSDKICFKDGFISCIIQDQFLLENGQK